MVCIYCGGATYITNSRQQQKLNRKWQAKMSNLQPTFYYHRECAKKMLVNNQYKSPVEPRFLPISHDNLL